MKQPFSLTDKNGTERHVDWDVFCEIAKVHGIKTGTSDRPVWPTDKTVLATNAYFDLVDRGFLGVEWFNVING